MTTISVDRNVTIDQASRPDCNATSLTLWKLEVHWLFVMMGRSLPKSASHQPENTRRWFLGRDSVSVFLFPGSLNLPYRYARLFQLLSLPKVPLIDSICISKLLLFPSKRCIELLCRYSPRLSLQVTYRMKVLLFRLSINALLCLFTHLGGTVATMKTPNSQRLIYNRHEAPLLGWMINPQPSIFTTTIQSCPMPRSFVVP